MNKQRHGKSQTYIGPALLQYFSNVQMINVFLKCNLLFCPNHQEIHKKKISGIFKSTTTIHTFECMTNSCTVEVQAHRI